MSIPIVYGIYHNRQTAGEGTWFCPICQTHTPYKQKHLRSICHLCFIPLCAFTEREYVKCKRCAQEFDQTFLEENEAVEHRVVQIQAALQEAFRKAMLHCMILIMKADGKESPKKQEVLERVYMDEFHREPAVRFEMEHMDPDTGIADELVAWYKEAGSVSVLQKYVLAKALVRVAVADGDIEHEEAVMLIDAGKELGFDNSVMKKLLHDELHGEKKKPQ